MVQSLYSVDIPFSSPGLLTPPHLEVRILYLRWRTHGEMGAVVCFPHSMYSTVLYSANPRTVPNFLGCQVLKALSWVGVGAE